MKQNRPQVDSKITWYTNTGVITLRLYLLHNIMNKSR